MRTIHEVKKKHIFLSVSPIAKSDRGHRHIDDITDSESSVDYESKSDRDLNYNDADTLTNEQMDQIFNAESDTKFTEFE